MTSKELWKECEQWQEAAALLERREFVAQAIVLRNRENRLRIQAREAEKIEHAARLQARAKEG